MDVEVILKIIQIVSAVLLILLVLLQKSEAGLGGAFGGGDVEGTSIKRRGPEKVLFIITICVTLVFIASVIASQLL